MQTNSEARRAGALALAAVVLAVMSMRGADAAEQPTTTVATVKVTQAAISQPVQAFGVVGLSASRLTTLSLPYTARIVQLRAHAGQAVRRGAVIATVEADPVAVATMQQTRSSLQAARDELQRTQSLYDLSLATRSQLDAARKAVADAEDNLAAQQKLGVAAGPIAIGAPVDGVVTQISVAQGDQVQPGAAIAQLASNGGDRTNATLNVDPSGAGWIHIGDTVTVRSLSAAQAPLTATGRVTQVGEAIDSQTQMIDVGASVAFGAGFLPGTRVRAEIATRTGVHWVVPRSAVLTDAHGACVYQLNGNRAHRVPVTVRVENGGQYGVDGALDPARPLVATGNYELQDGAAVSTDGAR